VIQRIIPLGYSALHVHLKTI